ncbi:MAG: hypothetical protein HFI09_03230 [Bacilli bacterium]|nr:hypothetical protein [Bacilli bacterium]
MELLKWIILFFSSYFLIAICYSSCKMLFQLFRIKRLKANMEVAPKMEVESCVPVSIIVPILYDDEQKLAEMFDVLLNLNYPSYEIVMVYGGTNHMFLSHINKTLGLVKMQHPYRRRIDTSLILDIYEGKKNHCGFTLIHKEKSGLGDSFNVGVNLAKYPYVVLLESGIKIDNDALSKMLYRMLCSPMVVACGGFISFLKTNSSVAVWLQNLLNHRHNIMNYSRKAKDDGQNLLWMIKKEMIFTMQGLGDDESVASFMARCYEYCWDHEMESSIFVLPSTFGYVNPYNSIYEYLISIPIVFLQICMVGLGIFFFLMAASFHLFSIFQLLLVLFYFIMEGFMTLILYYEIK